MQEKIWFEWAEILSLKTKEIMKKHQTDETMNKKNYLIRNKLEHLHSQDEIQIFLSWVREKYLLCQKYIMSSDLCVPGDLIYLWSCCYGDPAERDGVWPAFTETKWRSGGGRGGSRPPCPPFRRSHCLAAVGVSPILFSVRTAIRTHWRRMTV